jgi:hypothetical protein
MPKSAPKVAQTKCIRTTTTKYSNGTSVKIVVKKPSK